VDEIAVGDDVEYAVVALAQLRLDTECIADFGRQTGGLRQVVSACAVGDDDIHVRLRRVIMHSIA
jgi:hypothetical protein